MGNVTVTEVFLVAMVLIFAVPFLIWRVGRTEYYAPLVVVQIICGILLGPGVLGAAFPEYYSFVFRPEVITALNGIAWWAVMIFVWVAGIELDLSEAWKNRRETGVTAGLALLMPLLFVALTANQSFIFIFQGLQQDFSIPEVPGFPVFFFRKTVR
mgnify:CR=1 FL=1